MREDMFMKNGGFTGGINPAIRRAGSERISGMKEKEPVYLKEGFSRGKDDIDAFKEVCVREKKVSLG